MYANKILVPTDFSTTSKACLSLATSLARESGARLIIVHVQPPSLTHGENELNWMFPEVDRETLLKALDQIAPTDPAVRCDRCLLLGDPAAEIVRMAKDENVDLIVMGTHGRTGLTRFVMGSVAEAVVRRAACPVLTLKHAPEKVGPPIGAREADFAGSGGGI